ncbi:MAG: hypothetical protein NXH96_00680 [Alteromonadaceae bacterium]|nr:hypothetical protein [Alteromonadaceae bacterium]
MSRVRVMAALMYGVTGIISVILGSVYVLRDEFMPYHAQALGQAWGSLDPASQTLLLALMDVAGAGWAVTGALVCVLIFFPFRAGDRWARWVIPCALITLYLPILLATLEVLGSTPASPPWYGNAAALVATTIGIFLDQPWRRLN